MTSKLPIIAVGLALAALAPAALAQPQSSAPASVNMQATQAQQAFFDGLMTEYFNLSVTELKGREKVDAADYEKKSYALFRAYATAHGASPDALQNHLKAIPRQVVQIVKEDPKVLDSRQNFSNALVGPP
jgi:hypothetical protein